MPFAELFESWACQHVKFEELGDVWSYRLDECFGVTCLKLVTLPGLVGFDQGDCLRVALEMRLPIKLHQGLRIPIDILVPNSIPNSEFRQFRIQTVRDHIEDGDVHPFRSGDEPFDDEFTEPYFGLYGVDRDGMSEHIADRRTYADISTLARKLLSDLCFPEFPTSD